MDPKFRFWAQPHAWPRDHAGHVFLARAALEVGRSLFQAKWTGLEPVDKNAEAMIRFSIVQGKIRDALADGRIVSALRDPIGGSLSPPVSTNLWNVEDPIVRSRFVVCQMSPLEPFSPAFAGSRFKLIFVTRDSLDRYLCITKEGPPELPVRPTPDRGGHPAEDTANALVETANTRQGMPAKAANSSPGIAISAAKRGRPKKYLWDDFDREAMKRLEYHGEFNPADNWNQATLVGEMAAWCQFTWNQEPTESTLKSRISSLHSQYAMAKKANK
jgi:hypothetical protein